MSARVKEKSSEKKRVSRRYLTMFLFVMFWGILIIAKMAIVMFGERAYWNDVKENLVPANRVIDPRRGNILSDEGLLLASSMKQYRVFLDFDTYEKKDVRLDDVYETTEERALVITGAGFAVYEEEPVKKTEEKKEKKSGKKRNAVRKASD